MIEGFESHLRSQSDDVVTWSAYADYLTEHGDPRGELMTVQLALERQPTPGAERATLQKREAELLADLDTWLGRELAAALRAYTPRKHEGPPVFEFRRGWLYGVNLDHRDDAWDDRQKERLALLQALGRAPEARWVLSLRVPLGPDTATTLTEILAGSGERFFTELHLGPPLPGEDDFDDDPDGDQSAESPVAADAARDVLALDLTRVRSLSFAYAPIGERGARAVAACRLPALTALDLRFTRIGSAGLTALAGSPNLANVTSLPLQRNSIGEAGVRSLAKSPHLGRLRSLDLRYNPIGAKGASALAASKPLGTLEHLLLHREDVGPDGAKALAKSPHLPASIKRYWGAL